jgi:hypothetical protein
MIALRDGLPLVEFGSGRVALFERSWLVRSLVRAAQKAGYPQWWLAEHVAESVTAYLRERCDSSVVALPRLTSAVQSVLQVIGYAEVANHFEAEPPPVKLSLLELARKAGAAYELAFFQQLGAIIRDAIAARAGYFELFGLEQAVKQLRARKLWSRDCDALRSEIVSFVREQIGAAGPRHEVLFSLS